MKSSCVVGYSLRLLAVLLMPWTHLRLLAIARPFDECFTERQAVIDSVLTHGDWLPLLPFETNPLSYRTQPRLFLPEGFSEGRCANSSLLVGQRFIWQHEAIQRKRVGARIQRNKQKMCEIINGRNILIVGDSMSNGRCIPHRNVSPQWRWDCLAVNLCDLASLFLASLLHKISSLYVLSCDRIFCNTGINAVVTRERRNPCAHHVQGIFEQGR
jgi:hypothetical protein